MFEKAPTTALVIVMIAAGMFSGCASFGDLQQHHQVERILQLKEEPVGIVFPIRLDFDEADNMTTLAVQKELTESLESNDQVTVIGFELGQILCDTLDEAEDASVLDFAISPTEVLRAVRVSYNIFGGEAFPDGVTRKVWTGKDTEKNADGTYRTVSLSWTTECSAETFLQTVTTHGPNGSLSVVKSIPCGAGSSIGICIVEIDLDLRESGEPLMPVGISNDNTEDSDNTRRHLGVHKLGEAEIEAAKNPGVKRNLQSSTPEIDLLVFFNQTTFAELGNITPLQLVTIIVEEVQEGNDIMANSEIDLIFKLVHVQEWTQKMASTKGAQVLSAFRRDPDVADARSIKKADLVVLITPLDGICGLGNIYTGSIDTAFSTTDPVCLSGRAFTHELGHNLGCYHDRETSGTQHDYAHDLRYCTGSPMIHLMMAYRCGGVDIEYFSNPDVPYSGLPTGIANDADCARRIRETMVSVSEFSDAVVCNANGGSESRLANGWCNHYNNKKECMWDKGDCCKSCCSHFFCGSGGFDCKDPKCGGDAPTPAPTPPPPSNSASGRIETALLVEGLLYFAAVSIQLCLLSQF